MKNTSENENLLWPGAIGVFDSGVGGLSVLRAIRDLLPEEDLVYVADSGHAPYGDKSEAFIRQRTVEVGRRMVARGARAITVACNTATVTSVQELRNAVSVPVVAIEPAIKPAAAMTQCGVVGVLATNQTVRSPSVERLMQLHGSGVEFVLQACPEWVEQVERGERGLLPGEFERLQERGSGGLDGEPVDLAHLRGRDRGHAPAARGHEVQARRRGGHASRFRRRGGRVVPPRGVEPLFVP